MVFSIFVLGVIFTSCEKEENVEFTEPEATSELSEPPFSNYLVMSRDDETSKKAAESYLKSIKGLNIVSSIPEIGISVVKASDIDLLKGVEENGLTIVPDYEIKWIPTTSAEPAQPSEEVNPPSIGDNEPFFFYLWGMDAINAPESWNAGFTGKGASVFVLDSGIDAEHPDLSPNLNTSLSTSFIQGEDWNIRPGRYFNHGSHVAGTIAAANNQFGVIGVAPDAELVAVKVLSEFSGSGPFSSINAGIVYAGNNGADVINMSLGATLNKNGKLIDADGNEFKIPAVNIQTIIQAQQRAVDHAFNKGVTIIASAGNDGVNYDGNKAFIKLPGGLNNIITVSATAPEGWNFDYTSFYDVPASYTTYGRSLVDVAAPGGDFDVSLFDGVVSTGSEGFYFSSGTSMAAPHVSGVAALIIAKNGNGTMSPKEVARQIQNTSDNIDGNGQSLFFGKGRVNALRAVTE